MPNIGLNALGAIGLFKGSLELRFENGLSPTCTWDSNEMNSWKKNPWKRNTLLLKRRSTFKNKKTLP